MYKEQTNERNERNKYKYYNFYRNVFVFFSNAYRCTKNEKRCMRLKSR